MRGSVFTRCTCPARQDQRGRRVTCAKAHGSWSYKVDVGGPDGARRQVVKGGFPTKREAEEAMADAVSRAVRGQLVAPSKVTLGGYLSQWLATVKPTLAPAAFTNYRSCLALYLEPHLSDVPLTKLSGAVLTAHYSRLVVSGGRNGKPLSPTTVRTVHRVLSKALNDAVRDDLLLVSPTVKAVPPRRQRYEAAVWSAEQVQQFLTVCRRDRLYAAWLVALGCGLRRGELAGLRWSDLDLERGTLSVTTQRTTDSDYNVITKAPKGTGRRTVDLGVAWASRPSRASTLTRGAARRRMTSGVEVAETGVATSRRLLSGVEQQRLIRPGPASCSAMSRRFCHGRRRGRARGAALFEVAMGSEDAVFG